MSKTEYEKGFHNGFRVCKNKIDEGLDNYSCEKCIHIEVCGHRTKLRLSFGSIINISIGGNNPKWKQVEYMIAIVCEYYKSKERSD